MPGPARITQADLEAIYAPKVVRAVFSDDSSGQPGPRLASCCLVASRRAEAILLRAWSLEQIDVLFEEDEAVKFFTVQLTLAYGAAAKPEWTREGGPYAGLEQTALKALKDLADAQVRSRAETNGAGGNPVLKGNISTPNGPGNFVFAATRGRPNRGGY